MTTPTPRRPGGCFHRDHRTGEPCPLPGTVADLESGPVNAVLCGEHYRQIMAERELRQERWDRALR